MTTGVVIEGRFRLRDQVAGRARTILAMRNLKKSDVAEAMGMNPTSFSKRIHAKLAMDMDEIEAFAAATGAYRDWLLTGTGPMFDPECPHQGSNLGPAD